MSFWWNYSVVFFGGIIFLSFGNGIHTRAGASTLPPQHLIGAQIGILSPDDSITRQAYSQNAYAAGFSYGWILQHQDMMELGLNYRQYQSRDEGFDLKLNIYSQGARLIHVMPLVEKQWDFLLIAGVSLIYLDVQSNDLESNDRSQKKDDASFGHEWGFGVSWLYQASALRLAILREHVHKRFVGQYNFDGHVYQWSWVLRI